jgi:hypothetical protein
VLSASGNGSQPRTTTFLSAPCSSWTPCAMIKVRGENARRLKKGEFDLRRLEGEGSGGGYNTL